MRSNWKQVSIFVLAIGVLVGMLLCASCAATTSPDPEDLAALKTSMAGPKSGDSSASTKTLDMPIGPAVAWGASEATSFAASARQSPTNTTSGTGPVVTGFMQGLTAKQSQDLKVAVTDQINADPVMQSLKAELEYLMTLEYTAETQARIDAVREQYAGARSALMADMRESGMVPGKLDLGKLENIYNVGFITSVVGAPERAPTDAESQNIGRMLTNILNAMKGQSQILHEDEKAEGGGGEVE